LTNFVPIEDVTKFIFYTTKPIRTYLTKLDENWDQKDILTLYQKVFKYIL